MITVYHYEKTYKVSQKIHHKVRKRLEAMGYNYCSENKNIFWVGRNIDDVFGEWEQSPKVSNKNEFYKMREKAMEIYEELIKENKFCSCFEMIKGRYYQTKPYGITQKLLSKIGIGYTKYDYKDF